MNGMRISSIWTCGEWNFLEVTNDREGGYLYGFELNRVGTPAEDYRHLGRVRSTDRGLPTELYTTLDEAMVAAVGEKYTGRRGAGGTAVGTAADWFMKMIGAKQ